MELAYVTVIGAALGALARYALPGRRSYGLFLLPAIAAAVTAAVWVGLVWLGWTFDGGWIWVVSLVAGGVSRDRRGAAHRALPRERRPAAAAPPQCVWARLVRRRLRRA